MSKIGQKPIAIPPGVTLTIDGAAVSVAGPKGTLAYTLPHYLSIALANNEAVVTRLKDVTRQKADHGLFRSLIANAVYGVVNGWEKQLEIVGTGFNGKVQGTALHLKLGYSHPVVFEAPRGIMFRMDGNTTIIISGYDKQQVGEVAHQIKSLKKPDPYKGKGIRYVGEVIKLKPGKKAKAA